MMGKKKRRPEQVEGIDEAPVTEENEAVESAPGAEPQPDPAEEWKDKYLRTLADLDNFRKNVERQRETGRKYAVEGLLRGLLPVLDGLEAAAAAECAGEEGAAVRDGVELALKDLCRVLKEHGFETIETVGEPFDPRWHEAMGAIPSADHPAGTIVVELSKGYRLFDRVLRASRVQIAMAPPEPPAAAAEAEGEG